MRVVWTRPALADVLQIKEYLAADSPRYAQRVAERLFAAVERLSEYPLSGRMVPELNEQTVREVVDAPYRIVYRVRADVLAIVAVVHSARRFPSDVVRSLP
jgi:toxin ParE1/3/4